jgi:hypothetical protein
MLWTGVIFSHAAGYAGYTRANNNNKAAARNRLIRVLCSSAWGYEPYRVPPVVFTASFTARVYLQGSDRFVSLLRIAEGPDLRNG